MTQVVTVHTDFMDLNQMAHGLVGRVNETHVILPGPDPVGVGEWVEFAVTLSDGTPGFAGLGRCVTVVDNGEERLHHQRFDVVIDSLQFDTRGQQVFEHILNLNGSDYSGEHVQAEASVESVAFEDVAAEITGSKIEIPTEAPDGSDDDDETMIGDGLGYAAALEAALSEQENDGEYTEEPETVPPDDRHLSAPEEERDLELERAPFSEPPTGSRVSLATAPAAPKSQSNGATFHYPAGLPFPARPPRPDLEPAQRVSPAPKPAD